MTGADDYAHMARALKLAANGLYDTDPNPAVGCVIVSGGRVVGEGWTRPAGGPHAERVALEQAGAAARGATAYVTLEPCSHEGRTGPCAQALVEAGVARVVAAVGDPNPLVGGAGVRTLRAAGVEVEVGLLEAQAIDLNRGFFARMQRGTPWVTLKIAASLDGRTALANGASRWITGAAARADVHRGRARSSAVMTGIGTVLADDPRLTARPADLDAHVLDPARVILDSRLQMPPTAATLAEPGRVVVFTTRDAAGAAEALAAAGAEIEVVAADAAGRCRLDEVLARLASRGVNSIWVEAGPVLSGALAGAGLVDEYVVYFAPQLLGDTARGMFALGELVSLEERIELELAEWRRLGADLRLTLRPRNVPQASLSGSAEA